MSELRRPGPNAGLVRVRSSVTSSLACASVTTGVLAARTVGLLAGVLRAGVLRAGVLRGGGLCAPSESDESSA